MKNLRFLTDLIIVFTLCIFATVSRASTQDLNFVINKTWDNQTPEDNAEIHLSFKIVEDGNNKRFLQILVDAPFYNEPRVPENVPTDRPTLGLWNFEVVEAFFLGSYNEYLEIELAPRGHYIILFLKGKHNLITYELPLTNYSTSFTTGTGRWTGRALVPGEYFPCNVTQFNAYAIHKSDPKRVFMSLFPVPTGEYVGPDFHRLEAFGPINFGSELNPTSKCFVF